jgi:hypothetical protein
MPCVILNSYSVEQPITAGDDIFGTGSNNERDTPIAYYYDFSYSVNMIRSTEINIPNGAKLDKIAFEVETLTNGTYLRNNCDIYIAQTNYNIFPSNLQINLQSATDSVWNSSLSNQQFQGGQTIGFYKVSADPNIVWRDYIFPANYIYDNSKSLIFSIHNNTDNYVLGTQSYPRTLGTNLSGTQPALMATNRRDNSAYPSTQVVNVDLTFRPNFRIYYS